MFEGMFDCLYATAAATSAADTKHYLDCSICFKSIATCSDYYLDC